MPKINVARRSLVVPPGELEVVLEGDRAKGYSIGFRVCRGLGVALEM